MPNRIVREGIIDSARMEALVREAGWQAEVFYRRLHQVVDDHGRFDARVSMLRARIYPTLLDLVRDSDVQRWMAACLKAGLVRVYESKGQAFLEVLDFRQYARTASKFPDPPGLNSTCSADETQLRSYTDTDTKADTDTDTKAQSPEGAPQIPPELDIPSFLAAWAEWLSYRKRRRFPTDRKYEETWLGKLRTLGAMSAAACVQSSLDQRYQGLFPEKYTKARNGKPEPSIQPATAGTADPKLKLSRLNRPG